MPKVQFEQDGDVGIITIRDPPLNLFSLDLIAELAAATAEAESASIRALLLRSEGEHIDSVVRSLDQLRESMGTSKTDLARRIGRNPSSIRRLFTARSNPELRLVVQIANDLDADIIVVPRRKKRNRRLKDAEHTSAAA
jgi:DNA-binding XRE family transcriptional regulator